MADRVDVFTFKEGLLSRVAHDLRLHVERVAIVREGARVRVELDPRSLVVDGAMSGGRCDASALGAGDRAKILATVRDTILRTSTHRTIEFRGELKAREDGGLRVEGELRLVGVARPLAFGARREGGRLRASVALRPSDFGIAPYKALAGAIRLQDRVIVELDLDAFELSELSELGVATPA
ncbi:YceI family protein [Nannocystaceae bacterium ST9]